MKRQTADSWPVVDHGQILCFFFLLTNPGVEPENAGVTPLGIEFDGFPNSTAESGFLEGEAVDLHEDLSEKFRS